MTVQYYTNPQAKTWKEYEKSVNQSLLDKGYSTIPDFIYPPPAGKDEGKACRSNPGEDDAADGRTYANQFDIIASDGTNLILVECKSFPLNGDQLEGFQAHLIEKEKHFRQLLCFARIRSDFPIKCWLIAPEFPKGTATNSIRGLSPKASDQFSTIPFLEAYRKSREGGCLATKLLKKIEFTAQMRDFRSLALCRLKQLGDDANRLHEITGLAGAGKSVLLAYYAWQISQKKKLNDALSAENLSNTNLFVNSPTKYTCVFVAPAKEHCDVLQNIYSTLLTRLNGSDKVEIKQVASAEDLGCLLKDQQCSRPRAFFIDEAQDITEALFNPLEATITKEDIVILAIDRAQRFSQGESDKYRAFKERVIDTHKQNGTKNFATRALKILYRTPIQIHLAALAIAYRWLSPSGTQHLLPANTEVDHLLKNHWGIFWQKDKDRSDCVYLAKSHQNYPKSVNPIGYIKEKYISKTAESIEITKNIHQRLSVRCDCHPLSHDETAFRILKRNDVLTEIGSIAPAPHPKPCSRPDSKDSSKGVFRDPAKKSVDEAAPTQVLWVRFCSAVEPDDLDRPNLLVIDAMPTRDIKSVDGLIKGREWPVVVIEGLEQLKYNNGDEMTIRRLLRQIMMRSSAFLFIVKPNDQKPNGLLAEYDSIAPKQHSGQTVRFPGFRTDEIPALKLGLTYCKGASETGLWWHLTFNLRAGDSGLIDDTNDIAEESGASQNGSDSAHNDSPPDRRLGSNPPPAKPNVSTVKVKVLGFSSCPNSSSNQGLRSNFAIAVPTSEPPPSDSLTYIVPIQPGITPAFKANDVIDAIVQQREFMQKCIVDYVSGLEEAHQPEQAQDEAGQQRILGSSGNLVARIGA